MLNTQCTYRTADLPIWMTLYYYENKPYQPQNSLQLHSHEAYELYVHLSGDISFIIGSRLYSVRPGDLLLFRPGEMHQCILNEESERTYFNIFFSGNDKLLLSSLGRAGEGNNVMSLPYEKMKRFLSLSHELCNGVTAPLTYIRQIFELLELLEYACSLPDKNDLILPEDVNAVIRMIEENLARPMTVKDMAAWAFVSVNTLERHFRQTMNLSPSEYLKQRRLIHARNLLASGCSVQSACDQSGFSDCSHFITLFRSVFGVTPLKYKTGLNQTRE